MSGAHSLISSGFDIRSVAALSSLNWATFSGQSNSGTAPGTYYGNVNRSSAVRPTSTAASPGAPVIRQHQQNVEVVNVPEASKFFSSSVANRLEVLGKLNLNSLVEYLEHLEAYRDKNRAKIAHFNETFISVIKGVDEEQIGKMNDAVIGMLSSIERKLEACQLKRMMNNVEASINGQQAETETVKMKMTNEEHEVMEIIDLTGRDDIQVQVDANVAGAAEVEVAPEAAPAANIPVEEASGSIQRIQMQEIHEPAAGTGQQFDIRDELIEELHKKLRQLELATKQAQESTALTSQVTDLVPAWNTSIPTAPSNAAPTYQAVPSGKVFAREEPLCSPGGVSSDAGTSGKLCLGEHTLPLPKAFNRLSAVEKNALICQLPDSVRGTYLNLCWEARFYEHLTTAPGNVRDQLLQSFNL